MLKNVLPPLILTLITLQGCNSDIFVEPIPGPIDTIMISGTGEERTFKIPTEGLAGVKFYDDSQHPHFVTTRYYNKAGDEITQFSSIDDIAKITYGSPKFTIEFYVNGDEVTIKALDNTYTSDINVTASLFYGYEARDIKIIVTPGSPMRITFFGYDIIRPVSGITTEDKAPAKYTNNTDRPQRMVIYPYMEAPSRIETASGDETWRNGITDEVKVPYFNDGEWIEDDSSKAMITIGTTSYYIAPNTPESEQAYVDVPPHTTVSTAMSITYATLDVVYLAEFTQPCSGLSWPGSGNCSIHQPISYELKVSYE